jgi:hypothetical protein
MNTKLIIIVTLVCLFLTSESHGRIEQNHGFGTEQTATSPKQTSKRKSIPNYHQNVSAVAKKSEGPQNVSSLDSAKVDASTKEQSNSSELASNLAVIELLREDYELSKLTRSNALLGAAILIVIIGISLAFHYSRLQKNRLLFQTMEQLARRQQCLLEEQLKMARLKEQELLCEIEYKTRSLTTYALSMVQKNEMLLEVKESVEYLLKKPDTQSEHFKKLTRIIEFGITLDKDWDDFKMYFQEVQSDFFPKLKEKCPDLSAADLKLCALIKLNLNMKQAAGVLRISPDSVKVARHRLRKKFNLEGEANLTSVIMAI